MRTRLVSSSLVPCLASAVSLPHATRLLLASACVACGDAEVLNPARPPVDVAVSVAGPGTMRQGDTGVVTIRVENRSANTAESLIVQDSLDAGLALLSGTPSAGSYPSGTRTWDIGTLSPGASVSLSLQVRADADAGSTLRFGAALTRTAAPDTNDTNNRALASTTVVSAPVTNPAPQPAPQPEPAPAPGTVFSASWGTTTGNSAAAITDGGVFDRQVECVGGIRSVLSVMSGASVGWTATPNVLRVTQRGNRLCGNIERTQNTIPASTTHWGRFYFRNDETQNSHWHPVTYNAVGDIQIVPWARFASATGVRIGVGTSRDGTGAGLGYPYSLWFPGAGPGRGPAQLENGRWYRYEWEIRYLSATSYRIYPRIYDMNGTLLYDYRSFYQNDNVGSTAKSLQTWYEVDGRSFGITNPQLARNFGIGNEGPAVSTDSGQSWYFASVALSTAGWLGR